jgi:hypothetical protein
MNLMCDVLWGGIVRRLSDIALALAVMMARGDYAM